MRSDPKREALIEGATRILDLLGRGEAYTPHRLALASNPTAALWEEIAALPETPTFKVKCGNPRCGRGLGGRQLAKWRLDKTIGIVVPLYRVTPAHSGRSVRADIDKANDGKGPIKFSTSDGNGMQAYKCPTCGIDKRLSTEARMRLFCDAIAKRHPHIQLSETRTDSTPAALAEQARRSEVES